MGVNQKGLPFTLNDLPDFLPLLLIRFQRLMVQLVKTIALTESAFFGIMLRPLRDPRQHLGLGEFIGDEL